MTFIAAFHLDSYSLFGADSRATYLLPSRIDDEYRKLLATPSGLIAGAGPLPIVDSVGHALLESPALRPQDITALMRERHAAVLQERSDDANLQRDAAHTGWILATRRLGKLQLQLYHLDHAFKAQEVNVGFPMTLGPEDVAPDEFAPTIVKCRKRLRPLKTLTGFDDSLNYHLDVMRDLLNEARTVSKVLGPKMQIGFFRSDGEMEVMDELIQV